MLFAFGLNASLWLALARGDAEPLVEALASLPVLAENAQWATFLRNHDELDLSRLTAEQRSDVMAVFAPKADMRIYNRGIRRRLASMMRGDRRHIELAYSLQFTMPGTPVLRYGEEIGMGEDLKLPGREAIRTPMQWDDTPDRRLLHGRTRSPDPARPHARHLRGRQSQRGAATAGLDSLLRWFEQLIRVLLECPEICDGQPSLVDVPLPRSVLAHRYGGPAGGVLLLHNLADYAGDARSQQSRPGQASRPGVRRFGVRTSSPQGEGGPPRRLGVSLDQDRRLIRSLDRRTRDASAVALAVQPVGDHAPGGGAGTAFRCITLALRPALMTLFFLSFICCANESRKA